MSTQVNVPPQRLQRWFDGFAARNGAICSITAEPEGTVVATVRGARAVLPIELPGITDLPALIAALLPAGTGVVALVRRGGYSIARVEYDGAHHRVTASKTGSRYVQGRTAAGGQSQQRFARRRANQAAALATAAAGAARTVLGDVPGAVDLLVTGGDLELVRAVCTAQPLRSLSAARTIAVEVGEPRRRTIDDALTSARSVRILVTNAPAQEGP
ncbi:acVLRF1 family peptidyl-tRNA hydrolase [Cumulibacter soli]|uniref:acVLRF1 family peptidyl-tRNA hydrolase n=1 Tax=Cumulibacter soli TaxID=2546344 RepID=UPI00106842C7|nr:acVLRF1 family peptidyl-tRNA hydrolase [Cumulibacter soli]